MTQHKRWVTVSSYEAPYPKQVVSVNLTEYHYENKSFKFGGHLAFQNPNAVDQRDLYRVRNPLG